MSMIYEPGDHPGDVLHRASAVLVFLKEALSEGRAPGESVVLSSDALFGLHLIIQDMAVTMKHLGQHT